LYPAIGVIGLSFLMTLKRIVISIALRTLQEFSELELKDPKKLVSQEADEKKTSSMRIRTAHSILRILGADVITAG
jgi:hypothetical protein